MRGWRALGLFWAVILVGAGAGALTLEALGPSAPAPSRPQASAVGPAGPSPVQAAPGPASEAAQLPPGRIAPPDPALLETVRAVAPAALPRIAADGRMPRIVYARRAPPADGQPRIGLVVAGFGTSAADSRAAIDALPGPVTLAFSPYGADLDALREQARAAGHETLISIPMQPGGYPTADAGMKSLMTGADPGQNRSNLQWALSRTQGYVGATGALDAMRGERFAEQPNLMRPVLEDLAKSGLLYIDPRPGGTLPAVPGLASRAVDLVVDDPPGRADIEAKLAALERTARERGTALGLAGPPRPATIERLAAWSRGLSARGIVLTPASALVPEPAK